MKNVIIIHGCPSDKEKAMSAETRTYDKHWMPWLKKELAQRDIPVTAPLMPNPWEPVYEDFKAEFEKRNVDEDSVLIGHSCGSTFLVRWLGESRQKVSKLILVAPWFVRDSGDRPRAEYYENPIDETIKNRVGEIVVFTSNDDYEEGIKSVGIVTDKIGGKVIDLPNHGHYTMGDMGTEEFPELLDEIL